MGDGSFRMLTEAEAAEYDRNPDGYCDDLFTTDDPRSTVGTLHDEFPPLGTSINEVTKIL